MMPRRHGCARCSPDWLHKTRLNQPFWSTGHRGFRIGINVPDSGTARTGGDQYEISIPPKAKSGGNPPARCSHGQTFRPEKESAGWGISDRRFECLLPIAFIFVLHREGAKCNWTALVIGMNSEHS